MKSQLIIDNWMLQDINQALEQGLSQEETGEIVVDRVGNSHDFDYKPHAVFQIEALLALLVHIVLRESLIVDDRFMYVWESGNESLRKLREEGILNPFDFKSWEERLAEVRKAIVDELCVTQSIRAIQKANECLWDQRGQVVDEHMSQLVWGSAGYLARSHVYEAPYLGCPFRQALIRQTRFVSSRPDAVSELDNIIDTKRAKLFQSLSKDRSATYATFNLPCVAVEIIESSREPSQLLPVAVQLRDKYAKLRDWLKEYQHALDSEDPRSIRKYVKTLESIAPDIESRYPSTDKDSVNISLATNWLSVNIPVATFIGKIQNRLGVRAMLNDLVLADRGEKSLRKLLALFGENNTQLSRTTYQHLITRYSR